AKALSLSAYAPFPTPVPIGGGLSATSVSLALSNQVGQFSGPEGKMGLRGRAWFFFAGAATVQLPLTGVVGLPGGKLTRVLGPNVTAMLSGDGWTTGVVSLPSNFGGPGPLLAHGSHATATTGTLRHTRLNYVTPTRVLVTGLPGGDRNLALFGRLQI